MKALKNAPFFRIALALIAGILLQEYWDYSATWFATVSIALLLSCLFFDKRLLGFQSELIYAFVIYIACISVGSFWRQIHTYKSHIDPEYVNCKKQQLIGIIDSEVKSNSYGRKAEIQLKSLILDSLQVEFPERMLLYFPKNSTDTIEKFDNVHVWAYVKNFHSPYPGYKDYMNQKGIRYSLFADSLHVIPQDFSFNQFFHSINQQFSQQLSKKVHDPQIRGLTMAMFLGNKDLLDIDTRKAFSGAGASHILAISGLHIGIIFIFLNILLKPFEFIRSGKVLKFILFWIFLFGYMLLTGSSPAVVRATCMCLLILSYKRCFARYNVLNVLGIICFVQLLLDPDMVFHVSFQLSYAAVSGIVLFYPYLDQKLAGSPLVIKYLGAWVGISLCATLFTAPFVIYYFGQFSTYFLVTNILMSCLSFVTIMLGFLAVCFCYVPILSDVFISASSFAIKLMLSICEGVNGLPYAILDQFAWKQPGVYILVFQLLLVYLLFNWRQIRTLFPRLALKVLLRPGFSLN